MHVEFGKYQFKLKREDQQDYIWDIVRQKWIMLYPEEKVRKLWLHYLIYDKKYSPSLIQVEKKLVINGLTKRIDIAIYNQELNPVMIIECKAPNIPIDESVMEQLIRYNQHYRCERLIVSNGNTHLGFEVKGSNIVQISEL